MKVYYAPLVRWEVVDEIVLLVDEHEREEAKDLIIRSLDHIVMETILHHLEKELHQSFLDMVLDRYYDEALLGWIKDQNKDSIKAIIKGIRETKQLIKELLS